MSIKNLNLKLRIYFPDINLKKIKNFKDKPFYIIKKNLTPSEYNKALRLGEPSIELVRNEVRVYPNKNLFSHIIGNVDVDQKGISGIEMFLDKEILDKNKIDEPIVLSVDQNIQFLIRETLKQSMNLFDARGASSILLDAQSGKVISMISLPDYNPNNRKELINKSNLFIS